MTIETVKKASSLVSQIEDLENNLFELNKTANIDSIRIRNTMSGVSKYSYDVVFREDLDFMKTIKAMIEDKYSRMIALKKRELENL